MKKILFISHDASRSGAPIILLYFIKWIRQHHQNIHVGLLLLRGGELEDEMRNSADSFYTIPVLGLINKVKGRITGFSNKKKLNRSISKSFISKICNQEFECIYANTISSVPIAVEIRNGNNIRSRLIAHVHELSTTISLLLPEFIKYTESIDAFIAASNMVKEMLLRKYDVKEDKIKTVYEFSEIRKGYPIRAKNKNFTVGASGTFHWRKGGDIFIQVARYIKDNYPELKIRFSWVGKIPEQERIILESDIVKCGLQGIIEFPGLVNNPIEHYRNFDVFLLPSREDPFPLVCIEAGMLGVPIICFDKATGTSEILSKGGGTVISYLNIEAMAKQVLYYFHHPELKLEHGKQSKSLFSNFTGANISPELFSVIVENRTKG